MILFLDLKREKAEEARKRLLGWDAKEATRWRVTCSGRALEASKDPTGRWRLLQPVRSLADEAVVSDFLNSLSLARRVSSFRAPDSLLADYGLNPPRVEITLFWEQDSQAVLWGDRAPARPQSYCRLPPDEEVWLVSGGSKDKMCMRLERARHQRLFSLESYDVRQALLAWPGDTLLIRKSDDRWWVNAPSRLRASTSAVEDLLRTACNERAVHFPTTIAESLEHHRFHVALVGRDSTELEEVTLAVASAVRGADEPEGTHVGLRSIDSTVVSVRSSWVEELRVSPESLRDRRVVDASPYVVARILFRSGLRALGLAKDSLGVWRITEPVHARAEARRIGDLLSELCSIEAVVFLHTEQPYSTLGLDPPLSSILLEQEGEKPCSLLIGDTVDGQRYVINTFGELCTVDASVLNGWEAPIDSFRQWQLMVPEAYTVEEVTVDRAGKRVLHLAKKGQRWTASMPRKGRWEGEPVSRWLEDGRQLKGKSLLGRDPKAPASLRLTFRLWGEKSTELEVGELGDSLWARLPGEDAMIVDEEVRNWAVRLLTAPHE